MGHRRASISDSPCVVDQTAADSIGSIPPIVTSNCGMKILLSRWSFVALLLCALTQNCFGLRSLATLTPERAKELGVTLRSHPNGESGVRVVLEFKAAGELRGFTHVELEIVTAEGKRVVDAMLRSERSAAGMIEASFSADPAWLARSTLTICTTEGQRSHVGHMIAVKDFLPIAKPQ